MPKSKRDKKVSLTKTSKKGLLLKQKTIEGIRNAISKYEHVFLLTVKNMRNNKLKDLREEWKDSKFFFGKNKVIALALGKTKSDEIEDDINLLSQKLKGQCGLLMTNRDVPKVVEFFKNFSESEYARTGFKATQDVLLPQGPLNGFSHAIEPHLRKLGLPTSLEKGIIHLIKEYQVCKSGALLTPEQASILKLLDIQMAKFHVVIRCHWSKGKGFHKSEDVQTDDDEDDDDEGEGEGDVLQDQEMEEE